MTRRAFAAVSALIWLTAALAWLLVFTTGCAQATRAASLPCECVGCLQGEACRPDGALGGVAVCGCHAEERTPEVVLRAYPSACSHACRVHVRLELRGPWALPPAWRCPEVTWLWPDGTASSASSDCDPGGEPTRAWERWAPGRVELTGGEEVAAVEFGAEVTRNGALLARRTTFVRVTP